VWRVILSDPLPVFGLGSRYLPNYLMGRSPLFWHAVRRQPFPCERLVLASSCGISTAFAALSPSKRQVSYVFLTRLPLTPKGAFDLHVLGTPPAFILSQDQTLRLSAPLAPGAGSLSSHVSVVNLLPPLSGRMFTLA
jgi:hypothetical protein